MDNRPIGVFDSGVGGLTVVKELQSTLPGEDILYFGDTGRVPYGTRSREIIRRYAAQDIRYLLAHNVKAIVAACGTVSANFTEEDARALGVDVPFRTIVLPATRKACALSKRGRIGVIATPAAIRSGAYERAVRGISPEAKVFGNPCPLLVPLVENGMTALDCRITRLAVEMYLEPLIAEQIDTLILGCTHYPILYGLIDDVLHGQVTLIDAGAAAASELQAELTAAGKLAGQGHRGETRYRVTDAVDNFVEVAHNFLDREVSGSIEYVDIHSIESIDV